MTVCFLRLFRRYVQLTPCDIARRHRHNAGARHRMHLRSFFRHPGRQNRKLLDGSQSVRRREQATISRYSERNYADVLGNVHADHARIGTMTIRQENAGDLSNPVRRIRLISRREPCPVGAANRQIPHAAADNDARRLALFATPHYCGGQYAFRLWDV